MASNIQVKDNTSKNMFGRCPAIWLWILIKFLMTRLHLEDYIMIWREILVPILRIFISHQITVLVQVKSKILFELSIDQVFWPLKSKINRPRMHFLCGSKIDDLIVFTNTSDDKNYRSTCKMKYGRTFYSPKNTSEAYEIFQKYREGIYQTF